MSLTVPVPIAPGESGRVAGAPPAGAAVGANVVGGRVGWSSAGGGGLSFVCCADAILGNPAIPRTTAAAAKSVQLSRWQCKTPPPRLAPPPSAQRPRQVTKPFSQLQIPR